MITIGLTGSIGMGKSTAALMLKSMGCAVHDADACVRKALMPNGKAFEQVALAFPKAWDKKNHIINKEKLARLIFNDPVQKQRLESLLHPIVQQEQAQLIRAQKRMGRRITILDIPLLFETGADRRVDITAVVSAPYFIQRQRVLSRPHMSEEKFHAILNTQMDDQKKCALANFIIPTGLGKAITCQHLTAMLKALR